MVERALTLHERITPTPVTAVIFVGWLPACFVHWHCDYDRIRSLIMMIIFMMMTIENNLWLTSPMLATLSTPFWVWKTILRVFTRDGSILRKRFSRNLSIGRQTFRIGIIFIFLFILHFGIWVVIERLARRLLKYSIIILFNKKLPAHCIGLIIAGKGNALTIGLEGKLLNRGEQFFLKKMWLSHFCAPQHPPTPFIAMDGALIISVSTILLHPVLSQELEEETVAADAPGRLHRIASARGKRPINTLFTSCVGISGWRRTEQAHKPQS